MDLEVSLETFECASRIERFGVQPVQLLVDVLLREDENLELFTFDKIGTFGDLFDEHA